MKVMTEWLITLWLGQEHTSQSHVQTVMPLYVHCTNPKPLLLPRFLTLQMLSKEWVTLRGAELSTETSLRSFTASKRKKKHKKINTFSRRTKSNQDSELKPTIWTDMKKHVYECSFCSYLTFKSLLYHVCVKNASVTHTKCITFYLHSCSYVKTPLDFCFIIWNKKQQTHSSSDCLAGDNSENINDLFRLCLHNSG